MCPLAEMFGMGAKIYLGVISVLLVFVWCSTLVEASFSVSDIVCRNDHCCALLSSDIRTFVCFGHSNDENPLGDAP